MVGSVNMGDIEKMKLFRRTGILKNVNHNIIEETLMDQKKKKTSYMKGFGCMKFDYKKNYSGCIGERFNKMKK